VAPLPAINAPISKPSHQRHLQLLTSLSKYSAKLANIDTPYYRVGVNPKGPSSTANAKDKADRATTEQVLDPRTRVILYKMIGRGLMGEMNGCVSTGKEVSLRRINVTRSGSKICSHRQMYIMPSHL
jgi:RIO kinase 1